MELYLEAVENDITIASMECDIEVDRANLVINYYSDMENFYKESGDESYESVIFEAGNKIGNAIKRVVNKVIEFIQKCVDKVKELMASKKLKNTTDKLEKALKENPELKNKKITYKDYSDQTKAIDEYVKKIKKSGADENSKEEFENIKKKKPKIVTIALGAAVATLGTTAGIFYERSKYYKRLFKEWYEINEGTEKELRVANQENRELSKKFATYKKVTRNHIKYLNDKNDIKDTQDNAKKEHDSDMTKHLSRQASKALDSATRKTENFRDKAWRRRYDADYVSGVNGDELREYYNDHTKVSYNLQNALNILPEVIKVSTERDVSNVNQLANTISNAVDALSNIVSTHDDTLMLNKDIADTEDWIRRHEKALDRAKTKLAEVKTDAEKEMIKQKISEIESDLADEKSNLEELKKELKNK